ncbi:MAG: membrane protein insertion efficiency factor YidD [Bacteroidales bacterium]|nr:membrane protein insertion efficiency factor YidD [Bacteroidales bacterium]
MKALFCFIAAALCCVTFALQSQTTQDLQLLSSFERREAKFEDRKVTYGFSQNNRTLNPFYHLMSSAMYVYQKNISLALQRSCAFEPSCSAYSKNLIKDFGTVKGIFCTADRLMRCNRIALADRQSVFLINPSVRRIYESTDRYRTEK